MFETVAPEKFARRSRRVFYEALPLSIAFHALIGMAAVVAHVWTVAFPLHSPAQAMSFNIAELPPPPPPPPPPPKALTPQVPVKVVKLDPNQIVAPTVIPEEIPIVQPQAIITEALDTSLEGVEGGVPGGEIGGVFGGVQGGDKGGTIGGTLGGIVAEKNQVIVERDKPLPLYPMSQVYPTYPEEARLRSWEDQLVVRYVIGVNGRVKEVSVLVPPEREVFIDPTLRAIRHWRFRPLIKDGAAQEVVHELTVFYRLTQEG